MGYDLWSDLSRPTHSYSKEFQKPIMCPCFNHKTICIRDGRPAPRGTLPAGRGGFPAPPRTVGRGGFPAPTRPVKMIKTAGKLRGKIKAYI